ncbi:MAG: hypothetical protein SV760_05745 [Halobacteria archaeon]|nr:hypothetical protein [Halobacteria archaeon]
MGSTERTDKGYSYEVDSEGVVLRMEPFRRGADVYVRWEMESEEGRKRRGERGGLTEDDVLILDVNEYMRSDGEAETVLVPSETAEEVREEVEGLRDTGIEETLTDEEAEAFETDRTVILRAREILEDEGVPTVSEYGSYEFEEGEGERSISLRAEPHQGIAEVAVEIGEAEDATGYSPKHDLGSNRLTLPPVGDWGVTTEIEVPEGIADDLLDDLSSLQEELNQKREAYNDAVRRAKEEVEEDE